MSTQELYDKYVTASFYQLSIQDPLLATMLREVKTYTNISIPATMGVRINKSTLSPELHINPHLMETRQYTTENATAVLTHEALHILNAHMTTRFGVVDDMRLANIAMDMAINQYIKGLPLGGVDVGKFKTKDGEPMPKFKTFEVYLEILKETKDNVNKEELDKFKHMDGHSGVDEHNWGIELSPEEMQQYNKNLADLFKRSLDKVGSGSSPHGRAMAKALDTIEKDVAKKASIAELLKIAKKTLVLPNRTSTWTRANRRYGNFVPGFKKDQIPTVTIYLDSSGSISVREIQEFSRVINSLLETIPKKLKLANWHTSVYSFTEIDNIEQAVGTINESGGTDVECVMRHIDANPCNLAIVLTDGHYEEALPCKSRNVVYIISKGGMLKHGMSNHGHTFLLENLL